ncbi:UrvD/REP family ATP-dependent DNA helicase [Arcanobacterium phocae]|uniref:UrvD/REP family ATP-dependent DNA helicase n=1 Tax=Arcanobacterium phocae TaxID=131112 RepID=UPI001C0EE47B|nr:UrvD/REP family ATP-dependent DNA helicase [Arcanobacterium phocae]
MQSLVVDSSHDAVINACRDACNSHHAGRAFSVLGAPGTGKTTVLQRCVRAVLDVKPDARIAVLSPDRRAAGELRNDIVKQFSALTENVRVRSVTAFAFSIVSEYAQAIGRKEPELLSGPDQDAVIRDVIDIATRYYTDDGALGTVQPKIAKLEAFRREYRDLLTRSAELGITAQHLRELSQENDNISWAIGADLMEEYEKALAVQAGSGHGNPDRTDHARIVTQAAALLQQWDTDPDGIIQRKRPVWDWVIIDDISNCTLALRHLLRVLQEYGTRILVFGDPDVGVQGYRGGIPALQTLLERSSAQRGLGAQRFVLEHHYRGGGDTTLITKKLTGAIHVSGSGAQRKADYEWATPCQITGHIFLSEHDEIAYLATKIRHLHVDQGVPYSHMAVITRSRSSHSGLRQAFLDYGVPVQPLPTTTPLRFNPVVADLLLLIGQVIDASSTDLSVEDIRRLLTGPLFGLTSVELSSILGQMHGWEIAAGGHRTGERLLLSVYDSDPISPAARIPELDPVRSAIAKIREALRHTYTAEEILWVAWESIGKAEYWRDLVLNGSEGADQANRYLDAVIQLFRIAQRLADRDPANAGITDLLRVLQEQEVPEDSIARTSSYEGIMLTTPNATIGRTWNHVFISQLNDGVWPNLRLRNPLTRVPELVSVIVGSELAGRSVPAKQRVEDVVDDELRMLLYAVSRATDGIEITCVNGEDTLPSRFMSWLFPDNSPLLMRHEKATIALDKATFVGQLRQAVRRDNSDLADQAHEYLDRLSDLFGHHTTNRIWVDEIEYSSLESSDTTVRISPSAVENILSCPLRGVLDSAHGQNLANSVLAQVGTLIHQIAEETVTPDKDSMTERFEELWESQDFGTELEAQQLHVRALTMVDKLYAYLVQHPSKALRELYARVERDDLVVSGKIDRLEFLDADGQEVRVVDFKTGKAKPPKDEGDKVPQLLIYQWLVEQGGLVMPEGLATPTISRGAQLVHIGTPTKNYGLTEQNELDDEQRNAIEQMIEQVAQTQRSQSLAALPSQECRICTYKTMCPAQEGKRIFS